MLIMQLLDIRAFWAVANKIFYIMFTKEDELAILRSEMAFSREKNILY